MEDMIMVNKKKHHLKKRGQFWYFRKGDYVISLETTVLTEAIKLRDRMLENSRMTGRYTLKTEISSLFGSMAKQWADSKLFRDLKYSTQKDYRSSMNTHILPYFGDMPIEDIRYKNVTDFIETLSCSSKRINNTPINLANSTPAASGCKTPKTAGPAITPMIILPAIGATRIALAIRPPKLAKSAKKAMSINIGI